MTNKTLTLPVTDGTTRRYRVGPALPVSATALPPVSRTAYAAAHVVVDPLREPSGPADAGGAVDWDSTLAFRRHLWSLGLGVAEAMDTAQRGSGLSWQQAKELIARSGAEARSVGGSIACGVVTDQLTPGTAPTLRDIASAYLEQVGWAIDAGTTPVLMASRHLAAAARDPQDYLDVYDQVLSQVDRPVLLHWLGEPFDATMRAYWGSADLDVATDTVLEVMRLYPGRVSGIKISLLDADREVDLRRRLPNGVQMFTGDDFHYDVLIRGDDHGYSHALLGVFDAIAGPARAALERLDHDDPDGFSAILAPTLPLARHLFAAPTSAYKTGVQFLAWLNGYQSHFHLLGGAQSLRSVPHLVRLFELADQGQALSEPELAVSRMRTFLSVAGIAA